MDPVARRVNVLGPAGAVQAVSFDAALFAGGRSVELLGPKVNGNKHALEHHLVAVHGAIELGAAPELGSILAPCAAGAFDIARVRGWLPETHNTRAWWSGRSCGTARESTSSCTAGIWVSSRTGARRCSLPAKGTLPIWSVHPRPAALLVVRGFDILLASYRNGGCLLTADPRALPHPLPF